MVQGEPGQVKSAVLTVPSSDGGEKVRPGPDTVTCGDWTGASGLDEGVDAGTEDFGAAAWEPQASVEAG
jgi:hypothetical protein